MAFKIYTKTGDKGETGLFGGKRLPKSDPRIEAYGTVDELNSWLGWVGAVIEPAEQKTQLEEIQNRLFTIGSMLAADPAKKLNIPTLDESHIQFLERAIDAMEQTLPPLKSFILPGGHPVVAQCHIARCVCRRAERRVVA
ncbi:MAG: cob(I)yrinic acid a,c-diamide adenosyltransferase, partial [Bacteroidetes bacterium]